MPTRRLLILTAIRAETRAVERAIGTVRGVQVHTIGLRGRRLPQFQPEDTVIVAGLGGGLDPSLEVGDLVLDTPVKGLPSSLPWHAGAIRTTSEIVKTPREKAELFRDTAALAVDMEQDVVRQALPQQVHLVGLRAISDPADMAIEPIVEDFIDDFGHPHPLTVAKSLVRRPKLIPHLVRLNSRSRKALRNLGLGVAALVIRFAHAGTLR